MGERIDKLVENLLFAMNIGTRVPDHILEEIFGKNRNKNENVEREFESISVDEFNEEVKKKLGSRNLDNADVFFNEIVGYADIKKLSLRCIQATEPIHVILDGPPAGAKSMFLLQMNNKLENAYYVE